MFHLPGLRTLPFKAIASIQTSLRDYSRVQTVKDDDGDDGDGLCAGKRDREAEEAELAPAWSWNVGPCWDERGDERGST